ncbi:MAG: HAD family hydrolase [Acidiferrobacter sp.]
MAIDGIIFDLYGTLIDIETDESLEEIYIAIANFLTYEGIFVGSNQVRELYWQILKTQKEESLERYPEIDVLSIWDCFLKHNQVHSASVRKRISSILSHMFRGIARKRLQLYPGVIDVLERLRSSYRMGIVSDAQWSYALSEMRAVGLGNYFDPIIISANSGFRKPDKRIFAEALEVMNLKPSQAIYVGNDMYRDIYGASRAGIKTIFVHSNQGEKSYGGVKPDYYVWRFEELYAGIEFISCSVT